MNPCSSLAHNGLPLRHCRTDMNPCSSLAHNGLPLRHCRTDMPVGQICLSGRHVCSSSPLALKILIDDVWGNSLID